MSGKKITAAELVAKLNTDPKYVEERQREEQERKRRAAEWQRAEEPLVSELKAAGLHVESAWELANTPGSYPAAVPILLRHLPRPYPAAVREGIARALAIPEAKVGWELLLKLYVAEQEARAKDGLAVAIAAAADDELIDDVIALVRDSRHGPSRLLLLRALERSSNPSAHATLLELKDDPVLKKEIRVILHRLRRARQ